MRPSPETVLKHQMAYPGVVILYRVAGGVECYGRDTLRVKRILGTESVIIGYEMAVVIPAAGLETALRALVVAGLKVAIAKPETP